MACPICDRPHSFNQCLTYVTATQPLKDLIVAVYEQLPGLVAGGNRAAVADIIYEVMYSPTPQGLPQAEYDWIFWQNRALLGTHSRERVYLNVRPDRLRDVWTILKRQFPTVANLIKAKRCHTVMANTRLDTVVAYLADNVGTQALLNRLRTLRMSGVLKDTDFRDSLPPAIGRVGDLPGVGVAASPAAGPYGRESYGEKLCRLLAEVWTQKGQNKPISKWDFVGAALRSLRDQGIDLKRPWQARAPSA